MSFSAGSLTHFLFILLPLLSGYWVVYRFPFRYFTARDPAQKVFYKVAIIGILLTITSWGAFSKYYPDVVTDSAYLTKVCPPPWGENSQAKHENIDVVPKSQSEQVKTTAGLNSKFHNGSELCAALVHGGLTIIVLISAMLFCAILKLLIYIQNIAKFLRDRTNDEVLERLYLVLEAPGVWWLLYWLERALKEGDSLERMLVRSSIQEKPLLIELENQLVYVGWCSVFEPSAQNRKDIEIVPAIFGKLDKQGKVDVCVDYTPRLSRNAKNSEFIGVVLPVNRIASVQYFDKDEHIKR